jgi:hypothetical protein
MPAGEIDPGSRALGDLECTMHALKESFDRHCDDDDRRHQENITALRANTAAIESLARAQRVAVTGPIVDGYQMTKSRLAAWASIAFGVLITFGWIIEAAIKWAAGALFAKVWSGA